jgi:hypothetical protein
MTEPTQEWVDRWVRKWEEREENAEAFFAAIYREVYAKARREALEGVDNKIAELSDDARKIYLTPAERLALLEGWLAERLQEESPPKGPPCFVCSHQQPLPTLPKETADD